MRDCTAGLAGALILSFGLFAAPQAVALEAQAISRGKANPNVTVPFDKNSSLKGDSTASICVTSVAGSQRDGETAFEDGRAGETCTIQEKTVDKNNKIVRTTPFAGKGYTDTKFERTVIGSGVGATVVYGTKDGSGSSQSESPETPKTTATAVGTWQSQITQTGGSDSRTFAAQLFATAKVEQEDKDKSPAGFAAADVRDPMFFEYLDLDVFTFEFALGDAGIERDDDDVPVPELEIGTDAITGRAHFDARAGLSGVSLDGTPLDGDLFTLSIDIEGLATSVDDLVIGFLPWVGLGLSDAEIVSIEDFVRGSLSDFGGGLFGLAPGAPLVLFGDGGALPALTFDVPAGTATVRAAITADAALVPEPASVTLWLGALGLTLVLARRRRYA